MSCASSPCTGVCTLHDPTGLCLGCGRSLDEIIDWGGLSEPQRLGIMTTLTARLATLRNGHGLAPEAGVSSSRSG